MWHVTTIFACLGANVCYSYVIKSVKYHWIGYDHMQNAEFNELCIIS